MITTGLFVVALVLLPADPQAQTPTTRRATESKTTDSLAVMKESHYELRLLTRPLYRYGSAEGKVRDGTLWAFVQGTKP